MTPTRNVCFSSRPNPLNMFESTRTLNSKVLHVLISKTVISMETHCCHLVIARFDES